MALRCKQKTHRERTVSQVRHLDPKPVLKCPA